MDNLRRNHQLVFWLQLLAFSLALALSLLWRLRNFGAFGLNNDEGAYLMWARLVSEGYSLYSQTQSVSAPLFIEGLAGIFNLFGFSVVGGRLAILASFGLLAIVLSGIAYRLGGWGGAFAALAMTVVPTPFFQLSRQVMAEVPATLFAVLAAGGGLQFAETRSGRWLAAAGAALAVSLLVKPLYPAAILPIVWLAWRSPKSWRERLFGLAVFGVSLLLVTAAIVSFFDRAAFFDQVIKFRGDLRGVAPWDWRQNGRAFVMYNRPLWGIGLLAGAGALAPGGADRKWAWLLWLVGSFALVMWHNPLFPHHFIILLPPAIFLAVEFFAASRFTNSAQRHILQAGIVGLALLSAPKLARLNQGWLDITTGGREAEAARVLARVTRPSDFVVSDSQMLALWADRLTPPPLGDVALVAIRAERQTSGRLIAMSKTWPVTAVASWALRLPWLPEYLDWVEQNFWVKKVWDNDHILYFGPKHPPDRPIPNARPVPFAEGVILSGYSLDASRPAPGDSLPLTLYWQTTAPLHTDYTLFVQLLDSAGRLVAQHDGQPIYGYFPTTQWPVGQIIPDRLTLSLPADLPAGEYTLIAGLYNLQTMERLKRTDAPQDFAILTTLEIR